MRVVRPYLVWAGGLFVLLLIGAAAFWPRVRPGASLPAAPASASPAPSVSEPPSHAQAVAALPQSVSNSPGRPQVTGGKDTAAIELNQQANKLLSSGDFKGAIQLYEKAVALTPGDEDLHYNLGIAYARAGEMEKAEREYREALRLLPDYAEVHNNLGNLLLRLGRLDEAEEQFNQAISAMPEYAAAHNNLGIVRQRQKRFEDALASFQKAVQYDTNYFEAHFNLASSYLIEHQTEKALSELREVLRINPGFEPAQRAMATLTGQGSKPGP